MWKKDDALAPTPDAPRPREKTATPEAPYQAAASGERATIGRSITIRGDVSGDEDLLIQGRVEGSVDLEQQSVTVGQEGRVKANITGRVVIVEGEVEGDLLADEQIVLRRTARVQGDIKAARVVLEDGCSFRGGVDMGDPSEKEKGTSGSASSSSKEAPDPTQASAHSGQALTGKGKGGSGAEEKNGPGTAGKDVPGTAAKDAPGMAGKVTK